MVLYDNNSVILQVILIISNTLWKQICTKVLNKTFTSGNTHLSTHKACVSVFYGWAMFNYLLLSFSGHTGVDYHLTELPSLFSSTPNLTLISFRGCGTFSERFKACRPSLDSIHSCTILDINMSGMNSDQLHRSTLGIYSVRNRYFVWAAHLH